MAYRYPAGAPITPQVGPVGPDFTPIAPPGTSLDDILGYDEAEVRRRRSPFEPPPGLGWTPQIVPRSLFRQAAADDIRTRAEAIAIENDAQDEAFNLRLDAEKEIISGFEMLRDSNDPLDPENAERQMAAMRFGDNLPKFFRVAQSAAEYHLELDRRYEQRAAEWRGEFGRDPDNYERTALMQSLGEQLDKDIGSLFNSDIAIDPLNAAGFLATQIDRPFAAVRGAVSSEGARDVAYGRGPTLAGISDTVRRTISGFLNPDAMPWGETYRALPWLEQLPDNDFLRLDVGPIEGDISLRDIAAGAAGLAIEGATGAALFKGASKLDEALDLIGTWRKGGMAAEPIEGGGMGILRAADGGAPGAVERATDVPFRPRISGGAFQPITPKQIVSAVQHGLTPRRWVADLPPIQEFADHVSRSTNPVARAINAVAHPNANLVTPLGRLAAGYKQAEIASESLTEIALSGLDRMAQRGTGRAVFGRHGTVFKVDADGVLENVTPKTPGASLAWGDVFSRPGDYLLSPKQQEIVDHVHTLVRQADELRVRAGLASRADDASPEGWFYVPRTVAQLDDLIVKNRTNPGLVRKYEEMRIGMANGVRYSNDMRATIEAHIRSAYHEVNWKQLNDAIEGVEIPREAVSGPFAVLSKTRARNLQRNAALAVQPGDRIEVQQWREKFLPKEMALELERNVTGQISGLEPGANIVGQAFETLGDAVRFHSAVGDFAVQFIQGLPMLYRNPVVWGKSTAYSVSSFFDPVVAQRYISDHIDTMQEMAQHGVPVLDAEFFEALKDGRATNVFGLLQQVTRRMPALGDAAKDDVAMVLGEAKKQSFGRFQATYDTYLTMSRSMYWEAMRDKFLRDGSDLDALARVTRNLTSGLDSRALGVGVNQRGIESTWLAFAPRFARSTAAMAAEMFDRDPVVRFEAQRQVGQLMGGLAMTTVGVGLALDKSWEEIQTALTPTEGKKFLAYEINGDWVGVGGVGRGYIQMLAGSVALGARTALDPKTIADLNLQDFLDPRENPILGFIESRGAPGRSILGATIEGLSGGTIDAAPFAEINSLPDLVKHLGTTMLPFAVQGALEGEQLMTTAFAEFGARTSPQTLTERRQSILDGATRAAGKGDSFERYVAEEGAASAEEQLRTYLKANNPEALAELDKVREERIAQWRRDVEIRNDPVARAQLAGVTAREKIAAQIARTPDDLEDIRKAASQAMAEARAVRAEPDVRKAVANLPGADTEPEKDLERYYALFDIVDLDARDEAEGALRKEIGESRFDRILRNSFAVTSEMPEQWQRIQNGKRELTRAGFFDLGEGAFERLQQASKSRIDNATPQQRAILQPVIDSKSYRTWFNGAVEAEKKRLVEQGMEQKQAQQRAENEVQTGPVASLFGDLLTASRLNWVKSNQPLAREAIALGYLGAGDVNTVLSESLPPRRSEALPQPEAPRPVRRAANISTDDVLRAALRGESYGSIAERTGLTKDAVRQRILRASGGRGIEALREESGEV